MYTILFPFQLGKQNKDYYNKSLLLAQSKNAQLFCVTNVEQSSKIDLAYIHLLELYGNYQTSNNSWEQEASKTKRMVEVGTFDKMLTEALRSAGKNIIAITCPANMSPLRNSVENIVEAAGINKNRIIYI